MREIKFRCWDKNRKQMISMADLYGFSVRGMLVDYDFEVMQYTGLKDKNGKEIYEGDICKCKMSDDYERDEREEIVLIKYSEGAFCPIFMAYREFHDFDDKPLVYSDFEIIGNIYENPELLGEEGEK